MKKGQNFDNIPHSVAIGQKLRKIRVEKKLTMKDIAKGVGLVYQAIAKYENGNNRITIDRLYDICYFLEIDIKDILLTSEELDYIYNNK